MDQKRLTHLRQLEAESIHIIREVAAEFSNPVMMYSIGKDSSVMLHLATVPQKLTAASCWCIKTRKGWRWALTPSCTAAPNTRIS